MDTTEIRCPSGMRGRISKLLGSHFHRLLIDKPETATPEQFADLAGLVWQETIDPGPYNFQGNIPPFRSDILIGDRTYILLQSRIFTSGGQRSIRIECPGCNRWFGDPSFDYATLPIRTWPDADEWPEEGDVGPADEYQRKALNARRQFAAGEPCRHEMPDGKVIHFSLLTGSLLTGAIADYGRQFGGVTTYTEMAARIVRVDGLEMPQNSKPEDRRVFLFNWLTSYPDPDLWDLWDDIQDHECGPETDILKTCPHYGCNHEFGYQVDTMGFIMPAPPMRSMRSRNGGRTHRSS